MAHYVLSDVHGCAKRFHAMLQRISFSEEDTLYILGDIVDRGPEPIRLLDEIRRTPNMVMLLGNHEHMCLRYFSPDRTEREIRRWGLNNNLPTLKGLAGLHQSDREDLLQWIAQLPSHLEIQVNSKRFYLVHGFPGETLWDEVWGRPSPDALPPIPGVQVIVGHTPVCCLGRDEAEENAYCTRLAQLGEHMRIFRGSGFWDIDCGCGYELPAARLACIRLEDEQEFYV